MLHAYYLALTSPGFGPVVIGHRINLTAEASAHMHVRVGPPKFKRSNSDFMLQYISDRKLIALLLTIQWRRPGQL
jgi:hypothetical protein